MQKMFSIVPQFKFSMAAVPCRMAAVPWQDGRGMAADFVFIAFFTHLGVFLSCGGPMSFHEQSLCHNVRIGLW